MAEYFNILTNVAYRQAGSLHIHELLIKLIGFLQNSCKLSCILNRERNRSDSIDNPSELWCFQQSTMTPKTSMLMSDVIINSVLKVLTSLLPSLQSDRSSSMAAISEEDFTALINIVVFLTLCPWSNNISNSSTVTLPFSMDPHVHSVDVNLLSSILIKCLRIGACRPIIARFISMCIKQLTLYIGSNCPDRLHLGCQQLFIVLTHLLNDLREDRLVHGQISDAIVDQMIPLLRLTPLFSMHFLIDHIQIYLGENRQPGRSNEHFLKWVRENMRRWVRPLMVAHDQLQIRTKARHLLQCCIPIEEFHKKPDPFSVTGGSQPTIKIADPIWPKRTPPTNAFDHLRVVVKFVYSIVRDIDNELFTPEERLSSRTSTSLAHDKADTLSLEEHVEQLFEFLVSTLICQDARDLFPVNCAAVWRMYHASCRVTSQAYLANRLLIHSYVYHCIRDSNSNTDLFLSHTESVAEDIIKAPLLLDYEDRDMLPYNRSYLMIAFGCIHQCVLSSEAFSHALVFRQLPAWSIRFMASKGTAYTVTVQQITSIMKLLLSTTPNELYSSLTFIEEVKTTLLNQVVKATFENSFAKSFLLAVKVVLGLLMRSPLFTIERIVQCIMFDHNIQLLSALSDLFQIDKQSATCMLARVLAAVPTDSQLPVWPEIESVLGYMRCNIYDPDTMQCMYQILKLYPSVARTISRNLLDEGVPDNLIKSTDVASDSSDVQNTQIPTYEVVHMMCTSPKLDKFLSNEDRIEIAIHFAHVYPEFLMSFKVCDLRELDAFYDWMAAIFPNDNNGFVHSAMRNSASADLKFANLFLSALENETPSGTASSSPAVLDEQVSEVLLRALERGCFDTPPSSAMMTRLQRSISSIGSPAMTSRFLRLRHSHESSNL